ncbi:hypothetical protein L9F63_028263, partial [Diploptera punctata]
TINSSYDLVFMETLNYQSYHGLIHHVGSPPVICVFVFCVFILVSTIRNCPLNFFQHLLPMFLRVLLYFSNHMAFYERLQNTLFWLWLRYKTYVELFPQQERIMRKHFGEGPPSILEAERNMSLMMIGTNCIFGYPSPLPPAVITYHSLHVKTTPDPLPEDLKKYLDEATDGVIYFSFGTNVLGNHLPEEKIRIFIEAFAELPQKVLWKWESDILPNKPANVQIGKWYPQQDILTHPNLRLFITQCGLQSLQEAVHHGVPLLGIPFIADQKYNGRKIQEAGIGLQLPYGKITKESLLNGINQILHNSSFRNNAKQLSKLSRDEQESSIERTIWWAEYVLRHKGAKHLRSAALDLHWYQYLLLDVAAFLLISALFVIFIVYYCV